MDVTRFPQSVQAYPKECTAVLSWLSPNSWLTQDAFDEKSRTFRYSPGYQESFCPWTSSTVALWLLRGDVHIGVLQELMRHDLVEARKRAKQIEYRLTEKGANPNTRFPLDDPMPDFHARYKARREAQA